MFQRLNLTLVMLAILLLSACGGAAQPEASGVEHDMSKMEGNEHYDAMFIDSMIMHHQGAIEMANQALNEATRPEIKTMAEAIITAQEAEITQLQQWRESWYPDLEATAGMEMDMGTMEISSDSSQPFEQRFIEAMIPHHQGAVNMAKDAQQKAEHEEIKQLSGAIITAQEAEIAQMQLWLEAWFGQ